LITLMLELVYPITFLLEERKPGVKWSDAFIGFIAINVMDFI
jgi:hypothetical protein